MSAGWRLVAYAVVAAVLAGCGGGGSAHAPVPSASATPQSPSGASSVPGLVGLSGLSPAQLAGQRVIYSYSGLTPLAELLDVIRHGEAAGVIFFGGNIASATQIAGVISQLDQANASPDNPLRALPLLLMTDQEGGLVRRLPGAPLLSQKQIGASADPGSEATDAGTQAGQTLASVGMNVNLAPVLDVFGESADFDDQFGRSYSSDPDAVSLLGADFIAAQQAVGVAAAVKHFPGLGAAASSQNTDEQAVTLNVSRDDLRGIDELPYQAAIASGVKLVMVSWAVYPALDPGLPAGLSPAVIGGELRQRLGFTGVTITDALEAGALRAFGTTGQRATLAASAGMGLILCSGQSVDQGDQARIALQEGLGNSTLDHAAFTAAVQRIISLRSSLRS
ncbi:MAG TPA: glycoside hydrolase family 3 N-terminal domain-containing protein [Streptosporangiaceae bacterium]